MLALELGLDGGWGLGRYGGGALLCNILLVAPGSSGEAGYMVHKLGILTTSEDTSTIGWTSDDAKSGHAVAPELDPKAVSEIRIVRTDWQVIDMVWSYRQVPALGSNMLLVY